MTGWDDDYKRGLERGWDPSYAVWWADQREMKRQSKSTSPRPKSAPRQIADGETGDAASGSMSGSTDAELIAALRAGDNGAVNKRLWELLDRADDRLSAIISLSPERAAAQVALKAMEDVVSGNVGAPRDRRDHTCSHGRFYYEDCGQCVDEHLRPAIAALKAALG
jgi:hypothetical protein